MSDKHTAGPWWVVESGSVLRIMGPRENCTTNGVRPAWEMAKIDNEAFWDAPGTEDEDRANARLIAAAPDLLEALQALVAEEWSEMDDEDLQYELSQGNEMVRPYIAARAAIAKATNPTP